MASAKVDTSKPEVPINAQPGEGKGPTAETLNMWTPGISKEVLGLKIVAQPPELDEIEIE